MIELIIARHGNTFGPGDVVTRVGARTDLPLTDSGRKQGEALGSHFAEAGLQFDEVYCSPLKRTRETADLILEGTGQALEPTTMEFLREIDYGPDENVAEDIVRQRLGEKAIEDWEAQAIVPDGWIVDPDGMRAEWKRLFASFTDRPEGQVILIVTSNGIARFALQAAEADQSFPLKLKTGAYGKICIHPDAVVQVSDWNVRP